MSEHEMLIDERDRFKFILLRIVNEAYPKAGGGMMLRRELFDACRAALGKVRP